MVIHKGDYIIFPYIIEAMFLDLWESAVEVNFKGEVIDRKIKDDDLSMWLIIEPNLIKRYEIGYFGMIQNADLLQKSNKIIIRYLTTGT